MLGLHDLLSFVLAATAVIVVPGPATLYVASAARHSARRAVHAAAGIVTGDLVLITLSGLGFAALVARWPAVLSTIKLAGALYLGYLGVGLLRAPPGVPDRAAAPVASSRIWLKGLGITLTNPKPLMFFGAFFAMFIEPAAPSRIASFYALGALFELINVAYFAAIIGAIVRLRATDGFARFAAGRFNRVCGAGLLIYALVIAATLVR